MNTVKILTATMFGSLLAIATNAQKVSHMIKQGENISSLARQYNVSVADIFKLNNLNEKTTLHIGQKIIIPNSKNVATINNTPSTNIPKNVVPKNQHQIVAGDNLLKIAQQYHVTTQQLKEWNNLKTDAIKAGEFLVVTGATAAVKTAPKKTEPQKEETKVVKTEPIKKLEATPVIQETPPATKPQIEEKVVVQETKPPVETASNKTEQNYFQKQFVATKNELEGLCSTFKTIAGWHDGKYYVLLNNVEAGTIVKVSANSKSVYAKVLGALPNIKEDNNLIVRINSAAASVLGVAENKFNVKIEF